MLANLPISLNRVPQILDEPVSVANFREYSNITTNTDEYIASCITAVRERIEELTSLSLIKSTWKATFGNATGELCEIHKFPIYGDIIYNSTTIKPLKDISKFSFARPESSNFEVTFTAGFCNSLSRKVLLEWVKILVDANTVIGGVLVIPSSLINDINKLMLLSSAYTNVEVNPDLDVVTLLNTKVDKVPNYGLSENNFTTALKDKLDSLSTEAGVNTNNSYTWYGAHTFAGTQPFNVETSNVIYLMNTTNGMGTFISNTSVIIGNDNTSHYPIRVNSNNTVDCTGTWDFTNATLNGVLTSVYGIETYPETSFIDIGLNVSNANIRIGTTDSTVLLTGNIDFGGDNVSLYANSIYIGNNNNPTAAAHIIDGNVTCGNLWDFTNATVMGLDNTLLKKGYQDIDNYVQAQIRNNLGIRDKGGVSATGYPNTVTGYGYPAFIFVSDFEAVFTVTPKWTAGANAWLFGSGGFCVGYGDQYANTNLNGPAKLIVLHSGTYYEYPLPTEHNTLSQMNGQTSYISVAREGNQLSLYFNGLFIGSNTLTSANEHHLHIDRILGGYIGGYGQFEGDVHDIVIYNRKLTASERYSVVTGGNVKSLLNSGYNLYPSTAWTPGYAYALSSNTVNGYTCNYTGAGFAYATPTLTGGTLKIGDKIRFTCDITLNSGNAANLPGVAIFNGGSFTDNTPTVLSVGHNEVDLTISYNGFLIVANHPGVWGNGGACNYTLSNPTFRVLGKAAEYKGCDVKIDGTWFDSTSNKLHLTGGVGVKPINPLLTVDNNVIDETATYTWNGPHTFNNTTNVYLSSAQFFTVSHDNTDSGIEVNSGLITIGTLYGNPGNIDMTLNASTCNMKGTYVFTGNVDLSSSTVTNNSVRMINTAQTISGNSAVSVATLASVGYTVAGYIVNLIKVSPSVTQNYTISIEEHTTGGTLVKTHYLSSITNTTLFDGQPFSFLKESMNNDVKIYIQTLGASSSTMTLSYSVTLIK